MAKENPILKFCFASKDASLLDTSLVDSDDKHSDLRLTEFFCTQTVFWLGNKDFVISNAELVAWLYTIQKALGPISKKIKKWIRVDEQSLVGDHFPKGLCKDCQLYKDKIAGIGGKQQADVHEVFTPDVLSGGRRAERARLKAIYNAKGENPVNN